MTITDLRAQHKHAVWMHRVTRSNGWKKAIAALNLEIMKRSRPARTADNGVLFPKTEKVPYERVGRAT